MTTNDALRTRLRLLIVPIIKMESLIGEARRKILERPMEFVKRIYRMTDAHPEKAIRIYRDESWISTDFECVVQQKICDSAFPWGWSTLNGLNWTIVYSKLEGYE